MKFSKIGLEEALEQATKAFGPLCNPSAISDALNGVSLPTRATANSAGYDFYSPFAVEAKAGQTVRIPLFVKVEDMPKDAVLLIFNRSGLSLRKGLRLDNGVGVVDADYRLGIGFQATATEDISIKANERICQGIFVRYLTVDEDHAKGERKGGFGSTGR